MRANKLGESAWLCRRAVKGTNADHEHVSRTSALVLDHLCRHILNTLVQNEPGVLSRVAGTLAARGFNIDSLVVCNTEIKDLSRMCIVLRGQDGVVEQARRQLEDLVPVWAVLDYTNTKVIERELMLVKVSILGPEYFEESQYGYTGGSGSGSHVPPELLAERENSSASGPSSGQSAADAVGAVSESKSAGQGLTPLTPTEALRVKSDNMRSVIALAEQFRGRVVDVSSNSVIVEMSGKSSRCDAFLKLVRPFGVLECARSGEYSQRAGGRPGLGHLCSHADHSSISPPWSLQVRWSCPARRSHPRGRAAMSCRRRTSLRSTPASCPPANPLIRGSSFLLGPCYFSCAPPFDKVDNSRFQGIC